MDEIDKHTVVYTVPNPQCRLGTLTTSLTRAREMSDFSENPKLPDDAGEHLQPDDSKVWNP